MKNVEEKRFPNKQLFLVKELPSGYSYNYKSIAEQYVNLT